MLDLKNVLWYSFPILKLSFIFGKYWIRFLKRCYFAKFQITFREEKLKLIGSKANIKKNLQIGTYLQSNDVHILKHDEKSFCKTDKRWR